MKQQFVEAVTGKPHIVANARLTRAPHVRFLLMNGRLFCFAEPEARLPPRTSRDFAPSVVETERAIADLQCVAAKPR
jgi:hypothetical protein